MENYAQQKQIKKGSKLFLISSIVVILFVSLFFCNAKQGYFLDELYSYGLSNSYYSPFIKTLKEGDIVSTTITHDEIYNYLNVAEDGSDKFRFGSVYHNQVNDVHPPLFYAFLHAACSIFPGDLNKWTGLGVNLIFFALMLALVYLIARRLSLDGNVATLAMLVTGLSSACLSNMLYIRMYMLLALLSVVLAYLLILLYEKPRKWLYPAISLTIICGLLTQYFYVFYAFFACLFFLCWYLYKRQWKRAGLFTLFGFAGVGIFVVVWRACFDHLFSDKSSSGSSVMTNITHPDLMMRHIETFFQQCSEQMPVAILIGVIAVVAILILKLAQKSSIKLPHKTSLYVIVLGSAFVAIIFQVTLPPYLSLRYQYNVLPMIIILCCVLVAKSPQLLKVLEKAWPACTALCLGALLVWGPLYLYQEDPGYTESVAKHSTCPCLYISSNTSACVTSDMVQLLELEDLRVEDDIDAPGIAEYLSGKSLKDGLVVYIGHYPADHDTEGIMATLAKNYNLGSPEVLYSKGYSTAYYLPAL